MVSVMSTLRPTMENTGELSIATVGTILKRYLMRKAMIHVSLCSKLNESMNLLFA